LPRPPTPAEAARLTKRLARAAAALHEVGAVHGAIAPIRVVVDDTQIPTVMIAGLGAPQLATPASDTAAIVALIAHLVGAEDGSSRGLVAPWVAAPARWGALPDAPVGDGEALYAAADALEVAVLSALA